MEKSERGEERCPGAGMSRFPHMEQFPFSPTTRNIINVVCFVKYFSTVGM